MNFEAIAIAYDVYLQYNRNLYVMLQNSLAVF